MLPSIEACAPSRHRPWEIEHAAQEQVNILYNVDVYILQYIKNEDNNSYIGNYITYIAQRLRNVDMMNLICEMRNALGLTSIIKEAWATANNA
jgi:hypothetical protein